MPVSLFKISQLTLSKASDGYDKFCPICSGKVLSRTRGGENAKDTCENGHEYSSKFSLGSKDECKGEFKESYATLPKERIESLRKLHNMESKASEEVSTAPVPFYEGYEGIAHSLFAGKVDFYNNPDLIGIILDLAVTDQFNKNGEGVSYDTAQRIVSNFVHKPANIEHKQTKIFGHIVNAVITTGNPRTIVPYGDQRINGIQYYITVAAVFYGLADPELTKLLSNRSDELSGSWELLTGEFRVMAERNISTETFVRYEDVYEIEATEENISLLKVNGGSGRLEDGRRVFKDIINAPIPFGFAITTRPAAEVGKIHIYACAFSEEENEMEEEEDDEDENENESESSNCQSVASVTDSISGANNSPNQVTDSDLLKNIFAKSVIHSTDMKDFLEKLKVSLAAEKVTIGDPALVAIGNLFNEGIKAENDKWEQSIAAEKAAKEAAEKKIADLSASIAAQNLEFEKLNAKIALAEKEISEAKEREEQDRASAIYASRLDAIKKDYVLSEAEVKEIAKEIGALDTSDASFASYKDKFAVLFSNKSVAAIQKAKEEADAEIEKRVAERLKTQSTASTLPEKKNETTPDLSKLEQSTASVPNANDGGDKNKALFARFDSALKEGILLTVGKKSKQVLA